MSVSLLIRPAPAESGVADNRITPIERKCFRSFRVSCLWGRSSAGNKNSAGVMGVKDATSYFTLEVTVARGNH